MNAREGPGLVKHELSKSKIPHREAGQLDSFELFVHMVDDLDACVRTFDRYHRMRQASLLRSLLFDPRSVQRGLANKLAKDLGVDLEFEFVRGGWPIMPGLALLLLYPKGAAASDYDTKWPTVRVSLTDLLNEPSVYVGAPIIAPPDRHLVARRTIEHVAYFGGVVHDDDPIARRSKTTDPLKIDQQLDDEAWSAARRSVLLNGKADIGVSAVHHIAMVVRDGLGPLYDRVLKKRFGGQALAPLDYNGRSSLEKIGDEWLLTGWRERWTVKQGQVQKGDRRAQRFGIEVGRWYIEYVGGDGEVWRAYANEGVVPPRIEAHSPEDLLYLRHTSGLV